MAIPTFESSGSLQQITSAKYTIPKQVRFNGDYKRPLCDSIYEIPDNKNNQSTMMGFGGRMDIINRKEVEKMPSPLNYNFKSLFEDNLKKNKGYTLAHRLNYKVNFFLFFLFLFCFFCFFFLF